MKVLFRQSFEVDLDKIKTKSVLKAIERIIYYCEKATISQDIPNLIKMQGHKTAYRIRIGNYRIGVYIEKNKIEFTRILLRSKIYKYFP